MSAKTRADRLNESADKVLELLKLYVLYDCQNRDNCPNHDSGVSCDCTFCESCRLIEYVDGKPLTL